MKIKKNSIEYILWDWNGTLIDDAWLCVDVMNGLLRKYNKHPLSLEKYRAVFDFPVKSYYQKLGFNFDEHPFEFVGTELMEQYYRRWRECSLYAEVRETLEIITRSGLQQIVLSAAPIILIEAGIEHYRLRPYIDEWIGLNHHYATGKLDIAKAYIQSKSINPATVLLVGDTTHDYQVAEELGVSCLLFKNGHQSADRLLACNTPLIESYKQVLELVLTK
jgi:phosphoglycolate phosphatase